jgi:EAL domain-containing protein (putative c-di-GMP-specific phosphodiesterase class I)
MYVAKRSDTDCAMYEPVADRYSPTVIGLASDLRHAIEREQLVLHFQPVVDMRTRQPVSVEALCRWEHPERGMVPAAEFIALAEESGFIRQLGLWTLAEALRQRARLWPDSGRRGAIAVNMSIRNLRSAELPATIDNLLRTWNVPPSALRIEVTETTAMSDVERTLETLTKIHEMGVAISIDDFGTGYSSLAYLRRMPVDQLKIDRSFITDLETNPNSQAIVGSTIVLAHSLGLRAVAEGVETASAFDRLAALGCDLAQGNYLSPPLPADQLARWLAGPA